MSDMKVSFKNNDKSEFNLKTIDVGKVSFILNFVFFRKHIYFRFQKLFLDKMMELHGMLIMLQLNEPMK